ncbi:molybdenum cofactor biosynthesis protein E [Cellvibrio sp. BR]|uniref:molybdopterin synthase catalytic subunit MoaE n=1 Tax=Cellvibrio sp. BR TaxID=1134474 RepID=UPI000260185C|nr:molybdopterin synthase catalytic subunit MoaE [Cellvibrio sp. BR]EIK45465.1 molybdenum cofactor biosynthesis protein E [Cellvibrio sp. BR]
MPFSIAVQTNDFNVGDEYAQLVENDKDAGAVVFFVGRVREMNQSRLVSGLSLEYYPSMTERVLDQIMDVARQRWDLISVRIVHRVGQLYLSDQIVFVGVTSQHREHAFQAAEFLMDFLKTQAPFWKKEITAHGEMWVEAKESDQQRAIMWE